MPHLPAGSAKMKTKILSEIVQNAIIQYAKTVGKNLDIKLQFGQICAQMATALLFSQT